VGGIGQFFGTLFGPIGAIFHAVFYLPIFNVLMLLYQGVHAVAPGLPAFAIAIFLLTVIIRLCLFPLTRKQLQSSRAMQVLQPEVKRLQAQYKNDPQGLMKAQQALYREHGVSMYGGCLPLLIQMPFLYGLYYSLYTALLAPKPGGHTLPPALVPPAMLHQINQDIYSFLPHLTLHTLPATTFLWTNLATPDPLKILPILAGVLTFIQLRMAQPVRKATPPGQKADATMQTMSSMQYIMPLITVFIGLSFPSGLAFYWCISTGFSAVQQYFLTGWGSMFVGIPGMQHLVPAPQDLSAPAATTARALNGGSSRALANDGLSPARRNGPSPRGLVIDAEPPPAPRSPGLGGLRAMLRQLVAPAPAVAGNGANGNGNGNGAAKVNGNGNGNGAGRAQPDSAFAVTDSASDASAAESRAATAGRRNRPDRAGPTLIKPAATAAGISAVAASTAIGTANGAATNGATNGNARTNGTNGNARTNGTNGSASGTGKAASPGQSTPAAAKNPAGATPAARSGGSGKPANGGRSGQANRRRSGSRSKGGH
jgi:YidC/Oxa1 family membrane protein insertase